MPDIDARPVAMATEAHATDRASSTRSRITFRHGVAVADARGGRASEARGPTDGRGPVARMRRAGTRIRPRRATIRSRREPPPASVAAGRARQCRARAHTDGRNVAPWSPPGS